MYKYDLSFAHPVMNAAGMLGFTPDRHSPLAFLRLGAFVTNPISLAARSPAAGTRLLPFAGGFLLHTGFPNPGLSAVIRRYAGRWRQSEAPVIVHLLARTPDEIFRMVSELERVDGVAGLEIGLPPDVETEQAFAMLEAAIGERPVIVRLPFEQALTLGKQLALRGTGLVSLGAPRGALPKPKGNPVTGRLYGPAVFPLALPVVKTLVEMGLTVIGSGGIYRAEDTRAMLDAGALAVQADAVLWQGVFPDIE